MRKRIPPALEPRDQSAVLVDAYVGVRRTLTDHAAMITKPEPSADQRRSEQRRMADQATPSQRVGGSIPSRRTTLDQALCASTLITGRSWTYRGDTTRSGAPACKQSHCPGRRGVQHCRHSVGDPRRPADDFSGPQLVFFFSSCAVLCTLSWVIFVMRARAIRANRSVGRRVDYQIVMLRQNLDSSKRLIREINAEFDLQVAAAEKIKAEAEQNQRLAELNADQARAVRT